jgi:uncharacterized protein
MKTLKLVALIATFVASGGCFGADGAYLAGIRKWREDFDVDVRSGGWLAAVARVKVGEGKTSIGSDPDAKVVLPAHAPERVGSLIRESQTFRFEPAQGINASLDGKPILATAELSTKAGSGNITTGSLKLAVRAVGRDFYLFVHDAENPAIRTFTGTTWFEIDPSYRVDARFVAYAKPEKVALTLTHTDSMKEMESTGDVIFVLSGKQWRLKSFIDEGQLFLMFQDETNGKETYGGGRFLYAPLPRDGRTTLDFNKAFNPYCSVNENILCPVPPPGSRLSMRIPAGETYSSR